MISHARKRDIKKKDMEISKGESYSVMSQIRSFDIMKQIFRFLLSIPFCLVIS